MNADLLLTLWALAGIATALVLVEVIKEMFDDE